ncbi:MAG: minor capsid protein [Blautia sp.]|nr:minor capsid protein [Blautia sp.]
MNSQEYWKKRETEAKKHNIQDEEECNRQIQEIYENMLDQINKEINGFYARYAKKEKITMAEAKRRADQLDIKAYERKAKKYVATKDFSDQANEEMRIYNLTMKVNRLELLKANIGLEMVSGFDEMQKYFDKKLSERTIREFRRQAGILGASVMENGKMVHAIVNASFQNATYSERIWGYQGMLKAEIQGLLASGLIGGKNPKVLARHLEKRFGVSRSNAERLMITELARVQTEAQKQSFIRNGFEEYEYVACSKTDVCSICKALDGKHFKIEDMMPGTNAPPMHPRCHCSVAAYEDSEDYEKWLDFLEQGGTTEEWKRLKKSENQTGGKCYKPYDKTDTRDVAASKAYRKISRRNDVKTIARNSGFSEQDIKQIKRHIFYNKHQTYDGYKTLYPDYDMAVAWNRLYKGEQLERDILLLHHELLESTLEKKYNLSIAEAHRRAKERYDWEQKLLEDLEEGMEEDGLL